MATECSRNDGSKTQYYIVILDWLQGHSRGLEQAPESQIRGPLTVYNVDSSSNEAGQISEVVDIVLYYKTHSKRTLLAVSSLRKQSMILSYTWLKDHNLEVNCKGTTLGQCLVM